MTDRFELFETYTVPSIRRQVTTPNGFKWLVLADYQTLPEYKARLDSNDAFTTLYMTKGWLLKLRKYVAANARERWVMTTRLDNDDALEPRALHDLQVAATQRRQFLNLRKGSELDLTFNPPAIEPKTEMYNHFISYIETSRSSRTVYSWPHGKKLQREAPVVQLEGRPYWMRVIHDRNYLSD
jgi:hypothetical protein